MITNRSRQILAIAFSFPPKASSGSIRNLKMLRYLHEKDWGVNILTVHEKYFLKGNTGDEKTLKQIPDSINIIRTKCFFVEKFLGKLSFGGLKSKKAKSYKSNSTSAVSQQRKSSSSQSNFQELKDFITDLVSIPDKYVGWIPFAVWNGIKVMKSKPISIIYAVGKPWSGFFVGYILKILFRKPLVIDFMDPWKPGTWRAPRALLVERIETILERFIVTHTDFVIANTNELAQNFIERSKIPHESVDVLTCGYDELDFTCKFVKKPNNHFTITHTGSFYKKRSPVNFLKAVKTLLDKNLISPESLAINFIGSMSINDSELTRLLNDPILSKTIHQESWVPHKKALEYLYQSDILLLVQSEAYYLQIPAKLYEYVAFQKPIIALAGENGAVGNIIRREGWGEAISNKNVEKISNVILQYYQDFVDGKLNHYDTRRLNIEAYNVRNIASKMSDIFLKILEKKARI